MGGRGIRGRSLCPSTINKVHHEWRPSEPLVGGELPSPLRGQRVIFSSRMLAAEAFVIALFLSPMDLSAVKKKEILGGLGSKHIIKSWELADMQ